MNPSVSDLTFHFPEKLGAKASEDTKTTITVPNIAVIDSRNFPPCTMDYEIEEDCLENVAVKAIIDVCHCAPLTRFARGRIDLAPPKKVSAQLQCIRTAGQMLSKRLHRGRLKQKKEKTCIPCISPKNTYSVKIEPYYYNSRVAPAAYLYDDMNFTDTENELYETWLSPKIVVGFVCLDTN